MKKITKILLMAGMLGVLLCGGAGAAADDVTPSGCTSFQVTGVADGCTYVDGTLTITKAGEYTISMAEGTTTPTNDNIVVDADGEVTLTLNGVNVQTDKAYALHNKGPSITFPDHITTTTTVRLADNTENYLLSKYTGGVTSTAGVYNETAHLIIEGTGILYAGGAGDTGAQTMACGILNSGNPVGGKLTIQGGTIFATGKNSTNSSYGINSSGTLCITGEKTVVKATGGESAGGDSYGIFTLGDLEIKDSTVTAIGGTTVRVDGSDDAGINYGIITLNSTM